jgi:assimilatory nitrate reductase catalytic subunit
MNALPPHPQAVHTTCPYCGVGCGVLAVSDRDDGVTISGDPAHPANAGRLCSKGAALAETLLLDQRLLHPMMRETDGSLVAVDWDAALDAVANGLRAIIERDGPDAVAF